jgi:hypothetical protein
MLRAQANDARGVEQALRGAIAATPNWFKPHWTLAQLLAIAGRRREAIEEAQIAQKCDGGHDPEVEATLRKLLARP